MNCPKCEQNSLTKIKFIDSKKVAYLCSICNTFWFASEYINTTTGHLLDDCRDDQHSDTTFEYLDVKDRQRQEDEDEKNREAYELL